MSTLDESDSTVLGADCASVCEGWSPNRQLHAAAMLEIKSNLFKVRRPKV